MIERGLLEGEGRTECVDLGQYEAVGFDMGWVAMEMLGKDRRLACVAVIVTYLMVMIQSAAAQSTDGSRPGDLFSVDQVGQAAGRVLKNDGIYLDSGYLNEILPVVKGGNETGATSTGDAFVAGHFTRINAYLSSASLAVQAIFRRRLGLRGQAAVSNIASHSSLDAFRVGEPPYEGDRMPSFVTTTSRQRDIIMSWRYRAHP